MTSIATIISGSFTKSDNAPSIWEKLQNRLQTTIRQLNSKTPSTNLSNPPVLQTVVTDQPSTTTPQEQKTAPEWTLVLSDTDNDIETILYSLWLTGFCDRNGNWQPGLPELQIVHTGDWLNKWKPSAKTVAFFKNLQQTSPSQVTITILNGNHELSILQMADAGLTLPLSSNDLEFIRNQEIVHFSSNTMFIHGYPGLDLANILWQMQREQLDLSLFPVRLKEVFFASKHPLYARRQGMEIIGDFGKPKVYYEKQGRQNKSNQGTEVAEILTRLAVKTVIHGHKPHYKTQIDRELCEQLPGIRLVNNDNRIKQAGVGGLLLNSDGEIIFLNPQTMKEAGGEKPLRKQLRKRLQTRRKDLGLPSKKQKNCKPNLKLVA